MARRKTFTLAGCLLISLGFDLWCWNSIFNIVCSNDLRILELRGIITRHLRYSALLIPVHINSRIHVGLEQIGLVVKLDGGHRGTYNHLVVLSAKSAWTTDSNMR